MNLYAQKFKFTSTLSSQQHQRQCQQPMERLASGLLATTPDFVAPTQDIIVINNFLISTVKSSVSGTNI